MSTRTNKEEGSGPVPWSIRRRLVVSVLLLFHLGAVILAPWSAPPPAPELADRLARLVRPYLAAAYLNHGYRFFAPDPGPSHVVRYEMELADGEWLRGRIPDPERHWPRLIYHRHFMMTETLFNGFTQIAPGPPPEFLTATEKARWEDQNRRARQQLERLAGAMARQLLKEQGGHRVTLYLQEHALAFPEAIQRRMRLDDPRFYSDITEFGPYEKETP